MRFHLDVQVVAWLTLAVPDSALATLLRERREALGLTREQLAERSGVSVRTIARIELEDAVPKIDPLRRLGEILEVDLFDAARAS